MSGNEVVKANGVSYVIVDGKAYPIGKETTPKAPPVTGGQKVKKGTWLLMYHVLDDALWKDIKSGKLQGFSMGGFARRKPT